MLVFTHVAGLARSMRIGLQAQGNHRRHVLTHRITKFLFGLLDRVAPLCFAAPVFFHSARWYSTLQT